MLNLEGINSHIVIIDTDGIKNVKRIITVYRSFNPQNNERPLAWLNLSIDTFKINCMKIIFVIYVTLNTREEIMKENEN